VENVIALSLAARGDELSFDAFVDELRKIRYRNGIIDDYSSRLHYTCDWVFETTTRNRRKYQSPIGRNKRCAQNLFYDIAS